MSFLHLKTTLVLQGALHYSKLEVDLSVWFINHRAIKTCGHWWYICRFFVTWTVGEGKWSGPGVGLLTPKGSSPDTHWIGGWVRRTSSMKTVQKKKMSLSLGIEPWFCGRPACSALIIPTELSNVRCKFLNTFSGMSYLKSYDAKINFVI